MSAMRGRGAESDDRERPMDAALALFASHGCVGGAIHKRSAESAGMTRDAPYGHRPNKGNLVLASISREVGRTAAIIGGAVEAASIFRAQMIATLDRFLMVKGASVGRFGAGVMQNLSPASPNRVGICHRRTTAIRQGVFDWAHEDGEEGRVLPRVAVQIFLPMAGGPRELARTNVDVIRPADGCNPSTPDAMVDGFRSGSRSPRRRW